MPDEPLDELKPDTGGLGYLKPETGEPTGLPAREGVRPALSAGEWAELDHYPASPSTLEDVQTLPLIDDRHRAVALANHALPDGDPRKITRADVDALRDDLSDHPDDRARQEAVLRRIADKIAALLPPERGAEGG